MPKSFMPIHETVCRSKQFCDERLFLLQSLYVLSSHTDAFLMCNLCVEIYPELQDLSLLGLTCLYFSLPFVVCTEEF